MPDDISIQRSVLAEQVEDRLLRGILDGRFPPDTRIVETRVARELGVSQAPVREALRALEALGLVEILPFQGARVRRPSLDELLEAFVVRCELECLAARLAVPRLTEADLVEFADLQAHMEAAAVAGDRHEAARADSAFHTRLIRQSGSTTLERTWGTVEPFSRTYITIASAKEGPGWTTHLHRAVLNSLRARDVEGIQAALRHHFDEAAGMLRAGWEAPKPAATP
ncbi:MAG: GntR family transcriptional regulator [Candidatus Limnocylindrales bacterium]